jgi:hypothetical protein
MVKRLCARSVQTERELDLTFNATGKVLTDFSGSGSYDVLQRLPSSWTEDRGGR